MLQVVWKRSTTHIVLLFPGRVMPDRERERVLLFPGGVLDIARCVLFAGPLCKVLRLSTCHDRGRGASNSAQIHYRHVGLSQTQGP